MDRVSRLDTMYVEDSFYVMYVYPGQEDTSKQHHLLHDLHTSTPT